MFTTNDCEVKHSEDCPQLPSIANYYLQPARIDEYCNALSDVLCWLDGFFAGGGHYSPQTQNSLRELNDSLKSIQSGQATSNQSHTNKKTQ